MDNETKYPYKKINHLQEWLKITNAVSNQIKIPENQKQLFTKYCKELDKSIKSHHYKKHRKSS